MEAAEIGNIGERHVAAWLSQKKYSGVHNTQLPGCTDIEATRYDAQGNATTILVQVKTAVHPNAPDDLSATERRSIVSRANRNGYEAFSARVVIDDHGNLVGSIQWEKLN